VEGKVASEIPVGTPGGPGARRCNAK
jgi:hypothetical protein